MEQKLVEYFKEKYNPLAIILHGSRAIGKEREHSDWDFVFILKDENPNLRRQIIFGQNCEAKKLIYPVSDEEIKKESWHLRKGNTRILLDNNSIAQDILEKVDQNNQAYEEWSLEDTVAWDAFFRSGVDGMIDYKDDSVAFQVKIGFMYKKAINLWFDIFKRQPSSPQVYDALPIIKSEDSEFYKNLEIIAAPVSPEEKIQAAENIYQRLFKK